MPPGHKPAPALVAHRRSPRTRRRILLAQRESSALCPRAKKLVQLRCKGAGRGTVELVGATHPLRGVLENLGRLPCTQRVAAGVRVALRKISPQRFPHRQKRTAEVGVV
ncbi:hypothetical protein NDU88_004325 [Pleurodeles waltl]|uniref:Uncharacterized protein n=1 Tax=Pleurodeles waltl TaxID=8319 RepID=A0AAV7M786_PLEWA|nr:hypothetical protein NDU88_004325 [Pleurodeles waltl]